MRRVVAIVAAVTVVVVTAAVIMFAIAKDGLNETDTDAAATKQRYIALGDSVAAGIGLATYSDASACDRTEQSYPERLASASKYELTNLACSGATIAKGISGSQTVNELALPAQIDTLLNDDKAPDVITITIGANDIGWTRFAACYTIDCDAEREKPQIDRSLSQLRLNLADVLKRIGERYGKDGPTVVVTGYYALLQAEAKPCDNTKGIDEAELGLVTYVIDGLNSSIRQTVEASGAALFAPIDFSGHELCTSDSWIQGRDDKAPFHPTANGQRRIAEQVRSVIEIARGD